MAQWHLLIYPSCFKQGPQPPGTARCAQWDSLAHLHLGTTRSLGLNDFHHSVTSQVTVFNVI